MKFYKTFFTAVFFGGLIFGANAQNLIYEWGHGMGSNTTDVGKLIDNDSNGDIVLVSQFSGTYDAEPGAGITNLTSAGSSDVSIVKYDPDGNLIWARSIGGPLAEDPTGLDIDANGNIYISGGFQGEAEFDPGVGSQTATSTGGFDIFLLKLDSNGDFQWVYTTGSAENETGKSVVVGNNNNVYLTGYFRNTVDFDPGAFFPQNLTSQGGADVFVLELDDNGNFVSVHHAGGSADEDPSGIALDIYGDIYVTGYFQGTCNFNLNGFAQNLSSAAGNDVFVLKLNSSNAFEWVNRIGGTGNDVGTSVTTDKKGNILVGGYFSGTVDFDPGAGIDGKTSNGGLDLMIVKLENNGDYIFGVSAGGGSDDFIQDISVDMEGNIFTTGVIRNTVDFDPGVGTQNVTVTGGGGFADQFYWKLDENGNYLFAENSGGTNNDHGFAVHTYDQFIYTTGYFIGTADLDLTAGTETATSNGGTDISFQKHVNCNPINTTDVIVSCDPITWIDGLNYSTDNNTATFMLTNQYGCDSLVTLDFRIITIDDQTVTASATEFCDDGTPTFELGSSEASVFYSLIDQSNGNVLDGPFEGTGTALTFNGGNITTTTTFEVEAATNKNHKLTFSGNSMNPTYVALGNEINEVFAGKDQITVEAWINTENSNNLQTISSNYNGLGNTMQFVLRIDQNSGSNKAAFWIGTGPNNGDYTPVFGTTIIDPNTWYHVAGTYDGNELSVYVNGVLENTVNITGSIPYVENEFRIGGGLNTGTEYFYGDITGVRLWNIARTESEIDTDKDQCIDGNTAGLVAMYNMINGEGSTELTDESVNGYNGTLTNMDANTAWDYLDLPVVACQLCTSIMTQTPTVTINNSNTGTDVQEHCDTHTWIDGIEYTASNNSATFTLTNVDGCDSLVTLDLTINTTPTAGAVDNGDGTISATGTGNYQWIDCSTNTAINGETSDVFTPTQNGEYKVVVFNGSCSDTSDCVTISNVGLYENENTTLSAYPNPTNGSLTLNINNGLISSVAIIDATGRVIIQKQIEASNTVLDLSSMQNGVYFVEVENENNMKTMVRIVKK